MELCSIEDAFPKIDKKNSKSWSSKEERRAARRLAKKCKDSPAEEYQKSEETEVDPDRPAVKRMGEIPAFTPYEDAFNEAPNGKFENFRMPVLPSNNALPSKPSDYPAYFGKGLDDAPSESSGSSEGFSNMFSDSATAPSDNFEYEFGGRGADKAGAVIGLPSPQIDNAWKPLTPARATTAFVKHKTSGDTDNGAEEADTKPSVRPVATYAEQKYGILDTIDSNPDVRPDRLALQIETLTRRFDDLEARHHRNSKNEVILFVGTGVFILVCMDIVMRMAKRGH
jgi:hypothetical protein